MKAHCLFEQSGVFKNEFKKLGVEAYDYDIRDDFGETDYKIDIFDEIDKKYFHGDRATNIFEEGGNISHDDIILAFFPCTEFEALKPLHYRCEAPQYANYDLAEKMRTDLRLHTRLYRNYQLITHLVLIALENNFKLIIENPYTQPHYLTTYWALKPAIIDRDRRIMGDYYKKPTQYFFINIEPYNNPIMLPHYEKTGKTIDTATSENGISRTVMRSMISPEYARNFIRKFLLPENFVPLNDTKYKMKEGD